MIRTENTPIYLQAMNKTELLKGCQSIQFYNIAIFQTKKGIVAVTINPITGTETMLRDAF